MHKRRWNFHIYMSFLIIFVLGVTGCGSSNNTNTKLNEGTNAGEGVTTAAGDPNKGEIVYTNNCLPCHGKGGENGHNGPNLTTSDIAKDPDKVYNQVMNGKGTMPPFKDSLSQEQIHDVVAYINQIVANK